MAETAQVIKLVYNGRKKRKKIEKKELKSTKRTFPAVIDERIKKILDKQHQRSSVDNMKEMLNNLSIALQDADSLKEKPKPFDFKALTKYANPALDTVQANIGVYNPDTIDATIYEKMREDPVLAAALAMIKLPIMALPWRIECDDVDVSETVAYILKPIWKSLIQSTLTGVDFGFSAHEKVWERRNITVTSYRASGEGKKERKKTHYSGDAAVLKQVKPMYPSSVSFKYDDDVFEGIEQEAAAGASEGAEIEARKCFLFTHNGEFGNLFGKSRLKPAYKLWYWKELMYQFTLQYYERRGSPPIIVTAPPGTTEDPSTSVVKDNLAIALDLGSSFINNSVGAIPYEESKVGKENMWKVEYLLDDRRGAMFIEAIDHLDAKCFLALWVPESLGKGEGGSFAQTSVIVDLFLTSEKALVSEIENTVNHQLIPQIISYNFPPEKRVPAYIKMDQLDWNRRLAVKEIFIEMLRNIETMIQSGVWPRLIPDIQKMADLLEIPVEIFTEAVEKQETDVNIDPKKIKPRRRSDGSREETRKTIKPGTRPAEQQRARASRAAQDIEE